MVASNQLKTGDAALELILKSPFQLVQVWACERFLQFRPVPNAINSGVPRITRWSKVNGPQLENLRMVLDLGGEDFMWRPYATTMQNRNLPQYYPQKEKWALVGPNSDDELLSFVRCLRDSELVGLDPIEYYLQHRVAMQFGYDQDIPWFVSRPSHNSDIAWMHYMRELENVKLHLPSRLFEADVSSKYLKWWKQPVPRLEDVSEAAVPLKPESRRGDWSLLSANHVHVPPKCNSMEAEDPIKILKCRKKHKNSKLRQDGE